MSPPIPYLDLAGYKRRSKIVPQDIDLTATRFPGYLEHRIAVGSSTINARLKKRYAVPLGQQPPTFAITGTSPPPVVLAGRATVGSLEIVLVIDGAGGLGVATFKWSIDGGTTFVLTGVPTAAQVALGSTGLAALFAPVGTYSTDNLYSASAPVPEVALGWLVAILDVDVWQRRGVNPQDPSIETAIAERDTALAQLKEAADSKDGLFDLPTNDQAGDSAVTQGAPLGYSETSPWVWTTQQLRTGTNEDSMGGGTGSGTP